MKYLTFLAMDSTAWILIFILAGTVGTMILGTYKHHVAGARRKIATRDAAHLGGGTRGDREAERSLGTTRRAG